MNMAEESAGNRSVSRILGQYIVKYGFQFKFSLIFLGIIGAACFLIWMEGSMAIERMLASGAVTNEDVIAQLRLISTIMGKTSLLVGAVAFGLALILSHYIAGPVYRFEKTFEEMRNGNLGMYVRLRKKDAFHETADLFNQALTSLRNKLQKERETNVAALHQSAQILADSGQAKESEIIRKLADEMQKNPVFIKLSPPQK